MLTNSKSVDILRNRARVALDHPSGKLLADEGLLGSTACNLDDHNRCLVQSAQQGLVESLEALSEGIAEVEALSQSLQRLRDQVQVALHRSRVLVAPVRRVPVEILQIIFQFTHWNQDPKDGIPVAVSQVCRLWREVALVTPLLWSRIYVPLSPHCLFTQVDHLRVYAERSSRYPIDVIVGQGNSYQSDSDSDDEMETYSPYSEFEDEDGLFPSAYYLRSRPSSSQLDRETAGISLAKEMKSHVHRMASLVFTGVCEATAFGVMFGLIDAVRSGSMDQLKTFKTHQVTINNSYNWDLVGRFLRDAAPNLEHFADEFPSLSMISSVSPDKLKVFRGRPTARMLADIFRKSHLKVLEITNFDSWSDIDLTREEVLCRMNSLLALHLTSNEEFTDPSYAFPILPSLKFLSILHEGEDPDDSDSADFLPSLEEWGEKLRYLSLVVRNASLTAEHLEECLAFVPELEGLRVGSESNHFEVVQEAELPCLTYLEFHCDHLTEEFLQGLEEFSDEFAAVCETEDERFPDLEVVAVSYFRCDRSLGDVASCVRQATRGLDEEGVEVQCKQRRTINDFRFDGTFFEEMGGIFDDLYSLW